MASLSVSFILKDSKRFPDTNGWGYAQFLYDAASDPFTPYGKDSSFGKNVCYLCHTCKGQRLHFQELPPAVNGWCVEQCSVVWLIAVSGFQQQQRFPSEDLWQRAELYQ